MISAAAGAKGETLAQMRKALHLAEGDRFGDLMKAVMANLSDEDMVAISAYLVSKAP